jgi:hypothetical protein
MNWCLADTHLPEMRAGVRQYLGHALLMLYFFLLFPLPADCLDIPLTITNRENAAKTAEPVTSGVPLASGVLSQASQVRLLQGQTELPAQFEALALWPNGSVRWLLLHCQVDLPSAGSAAVVLQTGTAPASVSGITITNGASTLTLNTGAAEFSFSKNELKINDQYFEVTSGGTTYRAVPQASAWQVEESGPLQVTLRTEGGWYQGASRLGTSLVGFRARMTFFRNQQYLRVRFTMQNDESYGWDGPAGAALTVSAARFGISLLAAGGTYVLGQGAEKTWELQVPPTGNPLSLESRYNADGTLASGCSAPRPLALASPDYYASTLAWGQVSLPKTGLDTTRQADFDRFEKLQKAKVISSFLEDPPGQTGITLWEHLSPALSTWNDYGDLTWAGDTGQFSGNHYDWVYGMLLQFQRSGLLPFLDAARVFLCHETDFDLYHTNADGQAYNYQKHWESRPSHDSSFNDFGPGRPSHTWSQGYALYWLMTGDFRAKDAFEEVEEGVRQYVYESFNTNGHVDTDEIRVNGWLLENLVNLYRVNPSAVLSTTNYGSKTVPAAIKDVLQAVFDREQAAGRQGFVYSDPEDPSPHQIGCLQHCYFIEPAIKAYVEVFKGTDAAYATQLLGLIERMTTFLISATYGGDTDSAGHYRPRQIPFTRDTSLTEQTGGQVPYLLMSANAAGFCFRETGNQAYLTYARTAFQDYIRYLGVVGGDAYAEDPSQRTPTAYNSSVYSGTESKIHGWSSRYGQFYLAAEASGTGSSFDIPHIAGSAWNTAISVYNPTSTQKDFSFEQWVNGASVLTGSFNASADSARVLTGSDLELDGIGRITASDPATRVKLAYQYGSSQSLCEFFLNAGETGTSWCIPNSIQDWFQWFGIVVANPGSASVPVTFTALRQGVSVGTRTVEVQAKQKYVGLSTDIWGLTYPEVDMVLISSSTAIPVPLSITGSTSQDRHVFFAGAKLEATTASRTIYLPHIASQDWATSLTAYNGANASAQFQVYGWDQSGAQTVNGTAYTVPAHGQTVLTGATDLPGGGAGYVTTSSGELAFKLTYRFGTSQSLCEFFLNGNTATRWLIPNSIHDWFQWFGIGLFNPTASAVTATFRAYHEGVQVGEHTETVAPTTKLVSLSTVLWSGLEYQDVDLVVVETSAAVPAPVSITGNTAQDRHVFFMGQGLP